ncbi:winged helix-turn-helix transcriptional regulator [Mariniplasma anaerobium]|uniref:DNA-binding response regulator n=1 Tax=Mariniplasma anaerobium TaxID=2735436 RepID=A0A7U9TM90_9MOLU|nr:winged helix-turn-helix domain-containing protein [Mariniplasma anaerobium]BCR36176.1 DNA-binding response regulator [Mariniplasma anaerobium]
MHKIALITKDVEPFKELIELFNDNQYEIILLNMNDIGDNHKNFSEIDFICLNLEYNDIINQHLISSIKEQSKVPLCIFGKNHTDLEKIALFNAGSVGYIEFPFSSVEVYGRINAVIKYLHKLTKKDIKKIIYGPVQIDLLNHSIKNGKKTYHLTKVEYKILLLLLDKKDETVTKDRIIDFVWDNDKSATDNALGIHITRLRKKIEHDPNIQLLETVWGIGYRLNYKLCQQNSE